MPSEPAPHRASSIGGPLPTQTRAAALAARALSSLARASGLKPRFRLAYIGIKDAAVNPKAAWYEDSVRYTSRWRQIEHYVAARSALHRLRVTLRGWWQARQNQLVHDEVPITPSTLWEPASLPPDFDAVVRPKVEAYRQRLTHLNKLIHDFGAQPVYITQKRMDGRIVDGR